MKLVKAYNSVSLVLRIVIGMVIGAALALLIPNAAVTAPGIGILGTLFVGALKAIAPLLVFVLIISALAQSKEKLGKQFGTVIVLYLVSTFLAAVIAVLHLSPRCAFCSPCLCRAKGVKSTRAPPYSLFL